MKYSKIREEELKNKVGHDWFSKFDHTEILGNIDFTVFPKQMNLGVTQAEVFGRTPLLWAEAKTGDYNIVTMFVQLILTIGKARTFDKTLPPAFLGAFDFKKIAFIRYIHIQDIFYLNDFNWNVAPSNHATKEFQLIENRIKTALKEKVYSFEYEKDETELKKFIQNNIAKASTKSKIKIDKNNFIPIYLRWLEAVKPIIDINWDELKKANIHDNYFYLADLFVDDKGTQNIDDDLSILKSLFVVYENQGYKIKKDDIKQMFDAIIPIRDKNIYQNFWKIYKRPPIQAFQQYIIERQDLLVPQDIRERKGAYFTPRKWVELSQKYISDTLGENWQDEYYVWDCAAGTGNLLTGLTNKYNIYASTLDQADVNAMHERIDHGANLLKNHVFQFDFLNDDFSKLPQSLQDIINDPQKRKKLVMYINPPYAESNGRITINRSNTKDTSIYKKYYSQLQKVGAELFAQFMIRIYNEIPNSHIAQFSTLKTISAKNSKEFRKNFLAKYCGGFITPADTFDNVKGKFPIGFFIWNTDVQKTIEKIEMDVYNGNNQFIGIKTFYNYDNFNGRINDWLKHYKISNLEKFNGILVGDAPDFQNNNFVCIQSNKTKRHGINFLLNKSNIIISSIYLTVRHVTQATWINDRDQFLFPNDGWKSDTEFQSDCLAFTLFHGQNKITSEEGTNHWIPFREEAVNAGERFESHFMTDFIAGKLGGLDNEGNTLFETEDENYIPTKPLTFSDEATNVFDAGRELWKHYHAQNSVNSNASFYDIRKYFQGVNDKGRMNARSDDASYTELIGNLRQALGILAEKIEPKVYEYEFLKK